jgi:hypothetical protein
VQTGLGQSWCWLKVIDELVEDALHRRNESILWGFAQIQRVVTVSGGR